MSSTKPRFVLPGAACLRAFTATLALFTVSVACADEPSNAADVAGRFLPPPRSLKQDSGSLRLTRETAVSLYLVKNADLAGTYSLRLHVTPLSGDCGVLVQLIPALAPDQYSRQCAPGTGANRTKQTPAP
jgi:hypothetical protein